MSITGHPSFTDTTQSQYQPKTLNHTDGTTVGNVVPYQAFDTGVTPTDRSGTIAVASTAQQLMAANTLRRGFDFYAAGGAFWLNKNGGVAGPNSGIFIPQGGLYESPISGCSQTLISIWSATLGAAFTASEW